MKALRSELVGSLLAKYGGRLHSLLKFNKKVVLDNSTTVSEYVIDEKKEEEEPVSDGVKAIIEASRKTELWEIISEDEESGTKTIDMRYTPSGMRHTIKSGYGYYSMCYSPWHYDESSMSKQDKKIIGESLFLCYSDLKQKELKEKGDKVEKALLFQFKDFVHTHTEEK